MRVLLSAGEASGDAYAAALVREIGARTEGLEVEGVGGRLLAGSGARMAADSSSWGAISIAQSLAVAPRAARGYLAARRALRTGEPGLFIPIDFGFFNIRLARVAKRLGWKVLYFVPPGSWRRDRQGGDLPAITDAIVAPFPWSAALLRQAGANVHFFGHPLKQLIRTVRAPGAREERTVAALPGSRGHEVARNLPMLAHVSAALDVTLEFAIAANLDADAVRRQWMDLAPGRADRFVQGDAYGVLARAHAGLVCSGTATLEAALLRCPMVVVYRVTRAMAREAKLVGFKMPEFIALPNIALQRGAVPEIVGVEIDPAEVRSTLAPLLDEGEERHAQLAAFDEIDRLLGPDDAISQTADLAVRMMGPA